MKTIAIIPARGGSKRLPGKNLLPLAGRSLLAYSIEYAKAQGDLLDAIVVSTDSEEIKQEALALGVEVVDRPAELASDTASTVSVLQHAVLTLDEKYDAVVLFQVTNPLRPEPLFREALDAFQRDNSESLMTVTRNHQKFGKIEGGVFIPFNYEMGQRSQDLEPLYYENGLLYITKANLIAEGTILGEKNIPFVVDHPYAELDIDTQEDLDLAEYLLTKYQN